MAGSSKDSEEVKVKIDTSKLLNPDDYLVPIKKEPPKRTPPDPDDPETQIFRAFREARLNQELPLHMQVGEVFGQMYKEFIYETYLWVGDIVFHCQEKRTLKLKDRTPRSQTLRSRSNNSGDRGTMRDERAPGRQRPRILFMGLRRSGKSSIVNVVLYKMPPTETVYIPTTVSIKKHMLKSFRTFDIWDLPGQIDFTNSGYDTEGIFGPAGAIVWVLDAQDNYVESCTRLFETVMFLQQTRPNIKFAVFIHKTDSISDDYREDTVRDIQQRITDDLDDAGLTNPPITFHSTSVYDISISEALSKVLQLLIPQLPTFEALINNIAVNCCFHKLYLLDTLTKLFIASDTSPGDTASYSLLSDWFDTLMDLADLYSMEGQSNETAAITERGNEDTTNNGHSMNGNTLARTGSTMNVQAPLSIAENDAHSFVKGSRGIDLYLREITVQLVLVGWSKQPGFSERKPLIDYNVSLFSKAVKDCLQVIAPDPPEAEETQSPGDS